MHRSHGMPFFEDEEDPKKPRPVAIPKKRTGLVERSESAKDDGHEDFRHVRIRC